MNLSVQNTEAHLYNIAHVQIHRWLLPSPKCMQHSCDLSSSCTGETQQLEQHRVLIVYTLLGPTVGGRSNEKPQCERGIDWSSVGAEKGKMCFKKKKYSDKVLQQNTTFRLATRDDFLSRSNLQIWSVGYFGMDMPAMSRSTVLGSCRGGRKNDRKMIPKQLTVRWFPSGPLSITY